MPPDVNALLVEVEQLRATVARLGGTIRDLLEERARPHDDCLYCCVGRGDHAGAGHRHCPAQKEQAS
jgi:hypothetical protein